MYFMGKIRAGVAGAHKKSKSKTHTKKVNLFRVAGAHLLGAREVRCEASWGTLCSVIQYLAFCYLTPVVTA